MAGTGLDEQPRNPKDCGNDFEEVKRKLWGAYAARVPPSARTRPGDRSHHPKTKPCRDDCSRDHNSGWSTLVAVVYEHEKGILAPGV